MPNPHERIFEIVFKEDELTWQGLIYELVRSHHMDPWDIDVSLLTKEYIKMLKKLKGFEFRVSGKVLLAAAILLKIKSNRLVGEDLDQFDALLASSDQEEQVDGLFDEQVDPEKQLFQENKPFLLPRTPQPRKRKVSVYDLVKALEQALEVKHRRVLRNMPELKLEIPKKSRDITQLIKNLYLRIRQFFSTSKSELTFSQLAPPESSKEDKVYTFIPLLHLAHQSKIMLEQEQAFGEIAIKLRTEKEMLEEIAQ